MAHPSRREPGPPVLQGHRGARAAWPENTLAGFAGAIRAGADAIELDVGVTRDGVVVVCHNPALDPDLTRGPDGAWIASPGPLIWRHTLAELLAYDVGRARPGGRTARLFPHQVAVDGATVPTLAEVFALVAGSGVMIDVELKTDPAAPDETATPEAMADAVLRVADENGGRRNLALRSFDPRGLRHAARLWPELPLTWLTESGREWPEDLPGLAATSPAAMTWAPGHDGLSRAQVARAHALCLGVAPWTVNAEEDVARLIGWGVDGICTDDVAMARRVIDGSGNREG